MSRETENVLLLLVGVSGVMIVVTGVYTRYVKPTLMPWLLLAAIFLIALAIVSIARDVRRGGAPASEHHHSHRGSVAWLLTVPVVVLTFVVPPAIGVNAANTTVREVSTDVLRRPYPPLPAGAAPEVSLPEVLIRLAQDTAGTLDGRVITVTGFTMRAPDDAVALARIVIICCAADAQLARIALAGPLARQAAALPEETWLSVEGTVAGSPPTFTATRLTRIDPPANAYAY